MRGVKEAVAPTVTKQRFIGRVPAMIGCDVSIAKCEGLTSCSLFMNDSVFMLLTFTTRGSATVARNVLGVELGTAVLAASRAHPVANLEPRKFGIELRVNLSAHHITWQQHHGISAAVSYAYRVNHQ